VQRTDVTPIAAEDPAVVVSYGFSIGVISKLVN
jgi:hypothetical protein